MHKLIAYLIRYPIWVSVFMGSVIIFGLISLTQIRFSFFPESIPHIIKIDVSYPGASPEEVAEGVVLKIEENLEGLIGIDRVTSVSKENIGIVTIETMIDTDIDKLLADVKNAVDRIISFPLDAEKPIIYKQEFNLLSLVIGINGETDLYNLKFIAEKFRDDLLATDEISQVEITGLPELEFSIELSEAKLREYQLRFEDIRQAVLNSNLNISGGKFDTEDEEILIRAWGRSYYSEDIMNIPIRGNSNGTVILLRDVASVYEQWEDVSTKQYYNNKFSVSINISQTSSEDILAIAEKAKEIMHTFNAEHNSLEAVILRDMTIPLSQRIELLSKNGVIGLLLIVICLGFFLNLRLSYWVAMSIPFSFAGMFIVANFAGITINIMTLAGMIIVVGILVDDAIVVGENIFAHFERGKSALQAAIDGSKEVLAPVATSVLTTVIIFLAFFFLEGRLGEMMWQMALVVVASLLFSLTEAFLILPSHLAHSKGLKRDNKISTIRKNIESGINHVTKNIYGPILKMALKYKWIIVVIPFAFVMITIGLVKGGLVGVTFFPNVETDEIPINISLVAGSQEAKTDSLLVEIEKICWQINDEIKEERVDKKDVIISVQREIGSNKLGESGSHTGRILVQLLDGEAREMAAYLISNRIRKAVGFIPEAQNLTFGESNRFGKAVSISLLGENIDQLEQATLLLRAELKNFKTLKDITDTNLKGRREINITLKPLAHALGLTLQDVVGQIRQGFFGQEIQRIQRGRNEIRVWVRYRPEERSSLNNLEQMRIRTVNGTEYPFADLAEYTIERGITQINHLTRKQEIKVEANQTSIKDDLPPIIEEISTEVLPRVLSQVKGVTAQFEGQSREENKMKNSMITAFGIAFLSMFILIVLVFRSYAQAGMIFSLIPLGVLGAIWGHGIQGIQLNLLSAIGMLALAGIIVNDSIVFVDQVNRFLKKGQKIEDAIYNSGLARFRPIILTTLTTALGMAPLIFETSRQAKFLIPMAAAVAYGLVFGTVILLVILPAYFLSFNTIRLKYAHIYLDKSATRESVEPAVKELDNILDSY